MALNQAIEQSIVSYLQEKPNGASTSAIAKSINRNRITVTKYLEALKAQNKVVSETIAQATFWKNTHSKPKILIVDDEPHIVNLVKLSLGNDYEFIEAYEGLEAVEKIYDQRPHLVILDLMMPGISGWQVCKRIRNNKDTKNLPVIMLTAKADPRDKIKGIKLGADEYIAKPFDPLELHARVKNMLESQGSHVHPITKLPTGNVLAEAKRIQTPEMLRYNVELKNLDSFTQLYGYKRTNDVLILVSRILADLFKKKHEAFIGHEKDNTFTIMTKHDHLDQKVHQYFEKVLPFICPEQDETAPISITITKKELSAPVAVEQVI